MRKLLFALFACTALATPANAAGGIKASELVAMMQGGNPPLEAQTYANGVVNGMEWLNGFAANNGRPLYCAPNAITRDQLVQTVSELVEEIPSFGQRPFAAVATFALVKYYPCKN